jgi:hypothetical protein
MAAQMRQSYHGSTICVDINGYTGTADYGAYRIVAIWSGHDIYWATLGHTDRTFAIRTLTQPSQLRPATAKTLNEVLRK